MNHSNNIKKIIGNYYTEKITTYGPTPQGVDWNGEESQNIRFEQLLKVICKKQRFTILDYGCGYGALLDFMNKNNYTDFVYYGYDISKEMISKSKEKFLDLASNFFNSIDPTLSVDYIVASGIFNVKLNTPLNDWEKYIKHTLSEINHLATKGFSFNILTSYSDKEYMKDYLYYADPCYYFDYCKKNFSKNIALLHDYNLYEFTILVKK